MSGIIFISLLISISLLLGLDAAEFFDLANNYGTFAKNLELSLDPNFYYGAEDRIRDPDLELDGLNPARYIESRGFEAEEYDLETRDGYILKIYRVVNPFARNAHLKPVILHHGLMMSCYDWMINDDSGYARPPSNPRHYRELRIGRNLVFELANLGFDVWLGNSRGNSLSVSHVNYTRDDPEYWQFSVDQLAAYDSPALISLVIETTKRPYVSWVGHSQGAGMIFALMSMDKNANKLIRPFVSVAGATRATETRIPISVVPKGASSTKLGAVWKDIGGPIPGQTRNPYSVAAIRHCAAYPQFSCLIPLQIAGGYNINEMNLTRSGVYIAHCPSGTSLWTFDHFVQSRGSYRFQKFDRGPLENRKLYGTSTPPRYALERITNKYIAMIYSKGDTYATFADSIWTKRQLRVKLMMDHVMRDERFEHLDFLLGTNVHKEAHVKIIEALVHALF